MSLAPEIVNGLIETVIGLDGLRWQLAKTAENSPEDRCVRQNVAKAVKGALELERGLRGLLSGCMGEHLPPPPEPEPVEACVLEQDQEGEE